MPHPNQYDQPAEGGRETVDRALEKQKTPSKGQQKSKDSANPADQSKTQTKPSSR